MVLISIRRYLRLPQELKPSEIFKQDSLSPSKIALQIVLLQIFYYLTASILFYISSKLSGHPLELLNWLFNWEVVEFNNSWGVTITALWLLDSLICVFFLTVIVGRSKLAWDFAITIHAINFLIVLFHTGKFPRFSWFLVQILSSMILIFLGTWMSRWKELRDTFFEDLVEGTTDHITTSNINDTITTTVANESIELKDLEAQ
ncbi:probable Protein SYS1 [Saccharomycodes ludwigii]|uniref:Probable Protein SYS1 n=1 Tax=Saccharomycodes ludwigii TaxID=36035 RepID=A0A376BBI2_9ASCO|nr:hypothetical protein SCDLUD_004457 [Saccharomycodes ludwigii]KAH3899035.1 hypothetical protein SCDLUD_004457 [Saccharomycodes ludwigii]SSD61987.1 probable Protein SYS1 [Saccharomycodes ludwigii]